MSTAVRKSTRRRKNEALYLASDAIWMRFREDLG